MMDKIVWGNIFKAFFYNFENMSHFLMFLNINPNFDSILPRLLSVLLKELIRELRVFRQIKILVHYARVFNREVIWIVE